MRYLCLLLLCAACAPTTADGFRAMAADMDAAAYSAAVQATNQQAAIIAERTAIAQATTYAIEADRQRLSVTQTAQEMQATAFAATATAWIGTTEANAYLTNLEANQQADATRIAREQRDEEVDMMLANMGCGLLILVGYVTTLAGAGLVSSVIVERYRRSKWRYMGAGVMPALPAGGDVIDVTSSPNQEIIDLLEKSAIINTPEGNVIPRHVRIGMSGEKWSRAVGKLRVFGCVTTEPGRITMLTDGWRLGTLLEEFRSGRMGAR